MKILKLGGSCANENYPLYGIIILCNLHVCCIRNCIAAIHTGSCDLFPVMCMGCPEGATRDGVICRPMGLFSGQDADGVPDDCDNCTFTLTLIMTCPPV